MSPVEWYYARENKQMGPVSSLELKRLATAGELRPEDLVWREGMTEWSLASNVRGLFDGEAKPADSGLKIGEPAGAAPAAAAPAAVAAPAPTAAPQAPRRHLFDVLLDWLRPRFDAHFIDSTARVFRACGSYGLLAAMALAAVFAVIMTAKTAELDICCGARAGFWCWPCCNTWRASSVTPWTGLAGRRRQHLVGYAARLPRAVGLGGGRVRARWRRRPGDCQFQLSDHPAWR